MVQDISVVVLGGCGFLGQHVVAELLAKKENMKAEQTEEGGKDKIQWQIKDIKVLDVKPFTQDFITSQIENGETVDYQLCDVREINKLREKLRGCTAVINCAAVTPDFLKEDLGCGEHMDQVNVKGTENVVKVCQELGIRALVHTSTVFVQLGKQMLLEHSENLVPEVTEEDLVLGDYARGRLKAEKIVLDAHGTKSKSGITLRTVVLRPPLLYGEGDHSFVPLIHTLAKGDNNRLPSIGDLEAFQQTAYAGNIAVGHVYALEHLICDKEDSSLRGCGGLPLFLTDTTPPNNMVSIAQFFLTHAGHSPPRTDRHFIASFYLLWDHLSHFLASFIGMNSKEKEKGLIPTWSLHRFAKSVVIVSRMRAELSIDYYPPYSWEEALERSNVYYSCKLN